MAETSCENVVDAFGSYAIASHEPLQGLKRTKCKKCNGSRMFFCYRCYVYMEGVDVKKMPIVKLPYKIDIIKHAKEVDGKSTAIHAALLSPEDVRIYTYPTIPDYTDQNSDEILLVFPGKKALTMEEIFRDLPKAKKSLENGQDPIPAKKCKLDVSSLNDSVESSSQIKTKSHLKKVVFIDCTWSQAYGIFSDERLSHLPTVKLSDFKTVYWRHNEEMPYTYLATIEAIYFFVRHSHTLTHGSYEGQYDNLLYFYSYFYKLVQKGKEMAEKKKNKLGN